MSGPLFSSFMLLDRPANARPEGPKTHSHPAARTKGRDDPVKRIAESLAVRLANHPGALEPSSAAILALESALAGESVILRLASDLAGPRREAVRAFIETILQVTATLDTRRQEEAIARLAEVIMPDDLGAARGILAADNLALRDRFVAEVPCRTSAEVGRRAGHSTVNPHATAARWRKSKDVLSVHHRAVELYPAFQFRDDGRPHTTMRRVLAALPDHLSPWQRAFWFVSANGWLGDKAPADMLEDPEAVIAAAKRESEEVMG